MDVAVKLSAVREELLQRDADLTRMKKLNEALVGQCEAYMKAMAEARIAERAGSTSLQSELAAAQCTIQELEERLLNLQRDRTTHAHSSATDSMRVSNLQGALLSADNEVKAQIRARLETEARLKHTIEELRGALKTSASRESRLRVSDERLKKAESETRAAHERLDAVRAINEAQLRQLTILEPKCARLEAQLADSLSSAAALESMRKRLQQAQDSLKETQEELVAHKAASEQVKTLQADKAVLLDQVQRLQARERASKDVDRGGVVVPSSRTSPPHDAHPSRKTAPSAQVAASTAANAATEHYRKRCEAAETSKAGLEARLTVTQHQIDVLQRELTETQLLCAQLRQQVAYHQAVGASRSGSGTEVHSPRAGAPGDASAFTRASELEAEVLALTELLQSERKAHEDQLLAVESVVSQLAGEQAAVEATIDSLKLESERLRTDLQAVGLERDHLTKVLQSFVTTQARSRSASVSSLRSEKLAPVPTGSSDMVPLAATSSFHTPVGVSSASAASDSYVSTGTDVYGSLHLTPTPAVVDATRERSKASTSEHTDSRVSHNAIPRGGRIPSPGATHNEHNAPKPTVSIPKPPRHSAAKPTGGAASTSTLATPKAAVGHDSRTDPTAELFEPDETDIAVHRVSDVHRPEHHHHDMERDAPVVDARGNSAACGHVANEAAKTHPSASLRQLEDVLHDIHSLRRQSRSRSARSATSMSNDVAQGRTMAAIQAAELFLGSAEPATFS